MSQEMPGTQPTETPPAGWQSSQQGDWRARLSTTARDLEARTRELVREGNERRLVVQHDGRDIVNLPLTLAAVIGGITVLAAPLVAVVGAVAALLARVSARVERKE